MFIRLIIATFLFKIISEDGPGPALSLGKAGKSRYLPSMKGADGTFLLAQDANL